MNTTARDLLETASPKNVRRLVADRVLRARSEKKMKQEELANQLGISPSYLSKIETAKQVPTVNLIEKIAKVLEKSIAYFFVKNKHEEMWLELERDIWKSEITKVLSRSTKEEVKGIHNIITLYPELPGDYQVIAQAMVKSLANGWKGRGVKTN